MGGISIWQLLIIAVIVVLLFGTNKLRNLGSDLGSSIRGFKKAMGDEDDKRINRKSRTLTSLPKRWRTNSKLRLTKKKPRTTSRCKPCLILVLVNWYWCS